MHMRSLRDFALVLHPPVSSDWGRGEQLPGERSLPDVQDLAAGLDDRRKRHPVQLVAGIGKLLLDGI